jgi:hypothetical protein
MRRVLWLLFVALMFAEPNVRAGDIEISWKRKTLDATTGKLAAGEVAKSTEDCVYTLTLTNKSFKDAPAMEIRYIIFVERQRAGEKIGNEHVERITGTKQVEGIKSHQKFAVDTDKFTLNQQQLSAGWYFANGGKRGARDSVKGVWVRVYQGDEVIAEYVNPSSIKLREKWEGS